MCLLPFENHSFPIMKAGGSFSGWQRSMGRFNGNWDEVCEVLGKISQVTGSDLEEGIDLSCCPYGWIHSQGRNAQ